MDVILNTEITSALSKTYRQYLCGKLERPQDLKEIEDETTEIGISLYDEFTADIPHAHSLSTEYIYVLEGKSKIKTLDSGDETLLHKGDFIRILPNTYYTSKHSKSTKILFIKNHCINDKLTMDNISPELSSWLNKW